MDSKIEDFNWKLRCFLDTLNDYQREVNVGNQLSRNLLAEIDKQVGKIASTIVNHNSKGSEDKIICRMNGEHFEAKSILYCRLCEVSFPAARRDYLLHSSSDVHNKKIIQSENDMTKTGAKANHKETSARARKDDVFDSNNNKQNDPSLVQVPTMSGNMNDIQSFSKTEGKRLAIARLLGNNEKQRNSFPTSVNAVQSVENTPNPKLNQLKLSASTLSLSSVGKKTDEVKETPVAIPNVFDDNIYDFLESRRKSHETKSEIAIPVSKVSETIKKNDPEPRSWRRESDSSAAKAKPSENWRIESTQNVSADKRNDVNGSVKENTGKSQISGPGSFLGIDIYSKFPHLNPNKGKNPLEASKSSLNAKKSTSTEDNKIVEKIENPPKFAGLEEFFKKINEQNESTTVQKKSCPVNVQPVDEIFGTMLHKSRNSYKEQPKPIAPPSKAMQSQFNGNPTMNSFGNQNGDVVGPPLFQRPFVYPNLWQNPPPPLMNFKPTQEQMTNYQHQMNLHLLTNNFRGQSQLPPPYFNKIMPHLTTFQTQQMSHPPAEMQKTVFPTLSASNNRLKKNELSNSMKSLPSTPDARNKRPPSQSSRNERASSVINLNTTKEKVTTLKSGKNTAAANNTKQVGSERPKASGSQTSKTNHVDDASSAAIADSIANENLSKIAAFLDVNLKYLLDSWALVSKYVLKEFRGNRIMENTEKLLRDKFKNVKCHLMGSFLYNVANPEDSPIDFYMDLHDSFHNDKSGEVLVSGMIAMTKILSESSYWTNVKCSEEHRYGIVFATAKGFKQKCHFRFGTGVVVRNSEVIAALFDAQPICRQLVISVRLLMQHMHTNNEKWAGHFSGYIISLLAIFYFQVKKKLPSIASLQADAKREKCGENSVGFVKPTNVVVCDDRLHDLLMGFFDFYSKFEYDKKIISPFEGRYIRHDFRHGDDKKLSDTVYRFKKLIGSEEKSWNPSLLCIQDIFQHKINVSSSIQTKHLESFKSLCKEAAKALQANRETVSY